MAQLLYPEVSKKVLGACFAVHNALGSRLVARFACCSQQVRTAAKRGTHRNHTTWAAGFGLRGGCRFDGSIAQFLQSAVGNRCPFLIEFSFRLIKTF
jgi:hypothetical protein